MFGISFQKIITKVASAARAFSLVELMISLIVISCVVAAFTPVITRKLKTSNVTVAFAELSAECSKFGDSCSLCFPSKCLICSKECEEGALKNSSTCTCIGCDTYSSDCLNCNSDRCSRCTIGYGLKDKGCEICPAGYYSDGTTACKEAPVGSYVSSEGSGNYTPCPIGTYQNETGKTGCISCPIGTYQDETGKTGCKTCPEDNYCASGIKTPCQSNYGANTGSSSCTSCSAAISNCLECSNLSQCTKCSSGYYINSSKSCTKCEAGYACDGITRTQCAAGSYAGAGASTCSECSSGTYSSSAGASACSFCQAGKWSDAGASTCYSCPADSMCGSGSIARCTAGTYSWPGSSTCLSCSSALSDCTSCYVSGSSVLCNACKSGYSLTGGKCVEDVINCSEKYSTSCTACDSKQCTECSSGYYLNSSKICVKCAISNCTQCNTDGTCSACASGYILKSGACISEGFCTGENFMRVGNLCITRKNMGDTSVLTIPSAVTTINVNDRTVCDAKKDNSLLCCWQGESKWSSTSITYCNSDNGGYFGCSRTTCNWAAANEICSKFTYGGKTWRLPTKTELEILPDNSVGLGSSGLMLCNSDSGYSSAACKGYQYCHTSYDSFCSPFGVWGEYVSSSYAINMNLVKDSKPIGQSPQSYAFSVRCVTEMD